jgi:hypothetical protein
MEKVPLIDNGVLEDENERKNVTGINAKALSKISPIIRVYGNSKSASDAAFLTGKSNGRQPT